MGKTKGERLQVVLARFGVASRRGVVAIIEEGRVRVNGSIIRGKGRRVFPDDKVTVDGTELSTDVPQKKRYFILNKPKGVMTTMQDPNAKRTVADFFKDVPERLFPVGRLDRDTTGLLLMTNDGELAYRLTHPKFGIEKRYHVRVLGVVTQAKIKRFEGGVELEEGKTAPCRIEVEKLSSRETSLFVKLHEGKKRQIRRIFEKSGHRVIELERLNYGPLSIEDLRFGERRELTPREVNELKKATGLSGLGQISGLSQSNRRVGTH